MKMEKAIAVSVEKIGEITWVSVCRPAASVDLSSLVGNHDCYETGSLFARAISDA